MKNLYICIALLGFSVAGIAAESDVTRQLELMNSLTKKDMQLEFQQFESDMQARLNAIELENALIQTRLTERDNDLGNYIDAISWVSGVVIGFVGILFGIGAFILYRENQDVSNKTREQLDAWNEQTANLQNTFNQWFNDAKQEHTRELDLLGRQMRLRILLDQAQQSADEIYPEISPLYSNPKLEYLPIFRKIMTLDVGADIKRHTQKAINQIKEAKA
jgi:hypothetical protein|tara:strand:+ start:375 stop:1031 length:657 start_codon:yes stop_codon:yes gene_type:complete